MSLKNTLTAYTIAIIQNSQVLQYNQMHAALQSACNQSSLETPLKAEELLSAHFNLAVLEDQTIKHTNPDAEKSPDNTQNAEPSTSGPDDQTYVAMLRIRLQGERTPQEQLPLPAGVTTDWSMRYLPGMNLTILGTICLIITIMDTCTT